METNTTSGRPSTATAARPPKGLRQKLERMLAGAATLADAAALPTADGPMAKAEVVQRLAEGVARFEAVDAQLRALKLARLDLLDAVTDLQELHTVLKASLAVVLGRRSPKLAQFGIKPQADRRPLNSEQRVVRAEKARQTRRLRHTKGSRQKAAIKFTGKVDVNTELRPAGAASRPIGSVEGLSMSPTNGPAG